MDHLEQFPSINNAQASDITHITEDHKIRSIFRGMEKRDLIERPPGSTTSNTRYRKKKRIQ
jgi:hypothetical protein